MRKKISAFDQYFPSKEDFKAMSWCIDRKMRCYVEPKGQEFFVVFEQVVNGEIKKTYSPETYQMHKTSEVMFRIYKHIFKQNGENGK